MAKVTPSGWRWLAWRGGLLLVCALLVVVTWLIWDRQAARRMDQLVAEIRSRGEPVRWSEVTIDDSVPDEVNAAWYLKQAAAAMSGVPATPVAGITRPELGGDAWRKTAERMVPQNAAVFPLVRKARECTRSCWAVRPPGGGLPIPDYQNVVNLARLVRDKAVLHHERGEEAEAIECWRDIAAMSRSIGREPLMISGLVSFILEGIAQETIAEIALDMRIGDRGLSAAEARKLAAELLADEQTVAALASSIEPKITFTDAYLSGRVPMTAPARPLFLTYVAQTITEAEEKARAIRELRRTTAAEPTQIEKLIGDYSQIPAISNEMIQLVLRRRATAVTVALHLYRSENGRYPEDLEQLVPGYLPEVPVDPRSTTGRKLGYLLLEDGRRPVIVSPGDRERPYPMPKSTMERLKQGDAALPSAIVLIDASRWDASGEVRQGDPHEADGPGDGNEPEQDVQQ